MRAELESFRNGHGFESWPEVAEALGLSFWTLRNAVQGGNSPKVREALDCFQKREAGISPWWPMPDKSNMPLQRPTPKKKPAPKEKEWPEGAAELLRFAVADQNVYYAEAATRLVQLEA